MTAEASAIRPTVQAAQAVAYRLQAVARIGALFVIGVSSIVLAGWIFGLPALTSIVPGFASMAVPTALCFVLSGASLYLLAQPRSVELRAIAQKFFAAVA